MEKFIIKVTCPDQKGIVAGITGLMAECGINILDLTQHTASDMNIFMLKALFEAPPAFDRSTFKKAFEPVVEKFNITWHLYSIAQKERIAIIVSKTNHCLWELLLKHQDGELACDIMAVISNHSVNEHIAHQFGIPFYQVEYADGREKAEAHMMDILKEHDIDLIVLARFMQILSPDFIKHWKNKVINIHHGFLPAFQGAKPYHQAWYKGVKIIGATAHFANETLDQGPIITQEVINVSDRSSIKQLVQMGKNIERHTLLDAIVLYLEHSIFVHENRTFIIR